MSDHLSFAMEGEHVVQFGGVREFERTADLTTVVTHAMKWVVADVARVAKELGITVDDALASLQTYHVPAITPPGSGSHFDPLAVSYARRHFPTAHPSTIVGWKFAVNFVGDPPEHPNILTEGVAPTR